MKTISASENNIKEIIAALKNGAVLVLPTDTVYGLVCDAKNKKAVEKIFDIKDREKTKPLAVFVKSIEMAKEIAEINKPAEEFLKDSKTTVVVKAKDRRLSDLVYKDGTIGIRIPDYRFLNLILDEFNAPLAQTSANVSEGALTEIAKIRFQFGSEEVLIIDAGDLPKRNASSIIDLTKDAIKIIR